MIYYIAKWVDVNRGIIYCDDTVIYCDKDAIIINESSSNRQLLNDDVLNMMPKTFQVLNSLLEKVREKQGKWGLPA